MAALNRALATAKRAYATLDEILKKPSTVIVRDASIQRFEYTFEAVWKLLKVYLFEIEGIDCASPKSSLRQALKTGILSAPETEKAILMCDDRNLASHTYIETVAKKIYRRLKKHSGLMKKIIDGVAARSKEHTEI